MFIDLLQLEENELHVEHQYGQFELQEEGVRVAAAPKVAVSIQRVTGREVRVRGRLKAEVEVECDRCVSFFTLPIEVSFDLYYAPIETLTPKEDVPLTPRDLDYGFYRDNVLDVDTLIREQIFLALPFRWLCREDCRGLCPTCGANLNVGPCHCERDEVAPSWGALRDWKNRIQ